ncbi:DUF6868 family protein [Planctomycetota bacterium]
MSFRTAWPGHSESGNPFLLFLILSTTGNFVYRMYSKLFPMPKDIFNIVLYCFIGIYKIFFIAFNLVPYLAFSIIA